MASFVQLFNLIPKDLNRTYITLDGFVQLQEFRYLYFVFVLAAYVLIILFNSAIVFVIWTNKTLHEPMYVFIAALLVNSVLFSSCFYPKLLMDFLSERQTISYSACLFQCHLFYSFCSSEFILLAAMSYDRYVSICKPLKYPTIMRRTTVISLFLLAWLLPALQLMGLIIKISKRKLCTFAPRGIFCNNSVVQLSCVLSQAISLYGLVAMFNVTLLPLFFVIFTYSRILLVAYRSSGAVRKKVVETCLPHLLVMINFYCLIMYDTILIRVENDLPKIAGFLMNLQVILYNPLFNPIIYGLKMKEIHKHLKKMLLRGKLLGPSLKCFLN